MAKRYCDICKEKIEDCWNPATRWFNLQTCKKCHEAICTQVCEKKMSANEAVGRLLCNSLEGEVIENGGFCGPGLMDFEKEFVEKVKSKEIENEG